MFTHLSALRGLLVLSVCFGAVVSQSGTSCVTPEGSAGSCVAMSSCPRVLNLFQDAPKPLSAENRNILLNYRCEDSSRVPKVCCPSEVSPDPPSVAGHRNLPLLANQCGDVEEDKLHGGNKTGLFEFPFMALISSDENGERKFTCAGTIISDRHILTAAHCIKNVILAGVRVGEHDYSKARDCQMISKTREECAPPVQDFLIEKAIAHEDYNGTRNLVGAFTLRHDVGLIKLRGRIDLTKHINAAKVITKASRTVGRKPYECPNKKANAAPVCLPTTRELQKYNLEGKTLDLPGWGVTETNKGSTELLKINVPVISNERCGEIYNSSIADGVGFRQMCAGGKKGVSSCSGDSGGPLLFPAEVVDVIRYVQYGIVSSGRPRCGQENSPSMYTRVAYYMDWILDNLEPSTGDTNLTQYSSAPCQFEYLSRLLLLCYCLLIIQTKWCFFK